MGDSLWFQTWVTGVRIVPSLNWPCVEGEKLSFRQARIADESAGQGVAEMRSQSAVRGGRADSGGQHLAGRPQWRDERGGGLHVRLGVKGVGRAEGFIETQGPLPSVSAVGSQQSAVPEDL